MNIIVKALILIGALEIFKNRKELLNKVNLVVDFIKKTFNNRSK